MTRAFAVIVASLAVLTGTTFVVATPAGADADHQCGYHRGGHRMSERIREFMERYDADKDGRISQQEIDRNRAAWVAEFDTDKDLKLTLQEFESLWLKTRHVRMVRAFQIFDRDGDGKFSLQEYQRPLA